MKLNIEKETNRFSEHLNLTSNNQIIFSGIFGIGKTYFLKEYFNGFKENYESFILSPINYSISQNDDIIDYLKYDIAFQLLEKGIDFEKTDYSTLLTSQFYLKENFLDTMFLLAKNGGKIGKSFSEIFENFKELVNHIKKHNSETQIDEQKELIDFLTEITNRNNSIFEENRITELINKLIESLKIDSKKVVLIIDDIDRLDPEHIFRILNVFACHFDFDNFSNNKFGFDKVILACDIDNIRNLFHTKYGQNVDFSGYIDKFYSREIYYFDNKTIISNSIDDILKSIKTDKQTEGILKLHDSQIFTTILLKEILADLVLNNLLNLRILLKLVNKEYNLKLFHFKLDSNYGREINWHYMIFPIFDFLLTLYGSENSLFVALSKLSSKVPSKFSNDSELRRYGQVITIIDYKNHKSKEGEYNYNNIDLDFNISYEISHFGYSRDEKFCNITELNGVDVSVSANVDFPVYPLLKIALENYFTLPKINN